MWNVPQKCCQSLGQILILQEQKCAVIDVQKMITNFFFFLITKLVEDGKATKITATIQEEHQICSSWTLDALARLHLQQFFLPVGSRIQGFSGSTFCCLKVANTYSLPCFACRKALELIQEIQSATSPNQLVTFSLRVAQQTPWLCPV